MELLDVRLDQINEWLVVRRKLDKNWAKYLKPVETKHGLALNKLQADKKFDLVFVQEVSGYLQCREVMKMMENQSGLDKSRTMFGNYSNETLYEWENLMRSYEKNNLHLADCAKNLLQLGNYDIPSFKSAESSLEKQLKDLIHKETQISEEIQKKEKFYKEKCKNYEVSGNNIQYELKQKTRKIPEIYLKVVEMVKSQELMNILSAYESITKNNHNSHVDLPVISHLRDFEFLGNFEELQNKYCALIQTKDVHEEDDFEWKIETVDEEKQVDMNNTLEIPLEDKETRTGLINELVELQAFAEVSDMNCDIIKTITSLLASVRELILIHKQPDYLERLVQDFNRCLNHNLGEKLAECRKMQNSIKASLQENRGKILQMLRFAESLISFLENSINKLFPNVSVKIVGEVVKDIKSLLR
jgi:hypothetical protein